MALNLLIDLLANTAQFDAAFDKSEKRIKAFAREASQAGSAASKIGGALRVADVAGLDKLASGSKAAQAALGGLAGALMLVGAVPLPIAIGVAAVGGLLAFASGADTASEATERLNQRFEALVGSKNRTELQQLKGFQAELNGELKKTLAEIQNLESQQGAGYGNFGKEIADLTARAAELGRQWADTTGRISQLGNENYDKAIASLKDFNTGLQRQVETAGRGVEATVRFELENGKLAESMKAAGAEGERLRETILANARAIDQHNAAEERRKQLAEDAQNRAQSEEAHWKTLHAEVTKAAEEKQRLADSINSFLNPALFAHQQRLEEITKALAANAISDADAVAARKKAAKDLEEANKKAATSPYWDEARRNIQGITADLLKGAASGKSFGRAIVQALLDIAAQRGAAQLLDAIGASFQRSPSGQMGGFSGFLTSLFPGASGKSSAPAGSGKTTGSAGSGKHGGLTVVYSPTINAQGAMSPDMVIAAVREGEARVVGSVQQMLAMRARGVPA